jgi:Glycosyltransferase sugar-binding region containing DXD motif
MIPKIIHHVWPGEDTFAKHGADLWGWRASWLRHHPDWTMLFWRLGMPGSVSEPTGYEALDFLLSRKDLTVVVKSDVLRWYTLLLYGGIYADTDMECFAPFDPLLGEGAFCGTEMNQTTWSPSLVGAEKAHPFAKAMLVATLGAVAEWSDTDARVTELNTRPQDLTGPRLMRAVGEGHSEVVVHPLSDFDWLNLVPLPNSSLPRYARHHWTGCRTKEGWSVRMQDGRPNFGRSEEMPAEPSAAAAATLGLRRISQLPSPELPGAHRVVAPDPLPIPGAVTTTRGGRVPLFGEGEFDRPPQFKKSVAPAELPPNPSFAHPQQAVPAQTQMQQESVTVHRPLKGAAPSSSGVHPGYETFFEWYRSGGAGSGPGSVDAYTERFRTWLAVFLREHKITSVYDFGCGDWSWAKRMDWSGIHYLGVDLVQGVIQGLRFQFGKPGERDFEAIDPGSFEVPETDLVLCKDVLQHLPNGEVSALVAKLSARAKHCLWCNDRHGPGRDNGEIRRGQYRTLDLSQPPFRIPGEVVFEFGHLPDKKIVFWQRGART